MDTSEQYIKMCSQATEIQENKSVKTKNKINGSILNLYAYNSERREVWLPRQDQLQEIIKLEPIYYYADSGDSGGLDSNWLVDMSHDFHTWNDETEMYDSFEQLWLAFAMYMVYGKQWNFESETWEYI